MFGKIKKIKVKTPKGERSLLFEGYDLPSTEGRIPCTQFCPYADICDDIPHPEDPENPEVSFVDFCGAVGSGDEGGNAEDLDIIPKKGTIEASMKDLMNPDVYQKLLKNQKLVSIDSVVDSFCPGWCDFYKPDHTGCTISNTSCLMRELFIKNGMEPTKIRKEEKKEETAEDDGEVEEDNK